MVSYLYYRYLLLFILFQRKSIHTVTVSDCRWCEPYEPIACDRKLLRHNLRHSQSHNLLTIIVVLSEAVQSAALTLVVSG